MGNGFDECGYAYTDEWHQSQDHCTIGIDPCYGRGRCPSFMTCDELWAMRRAKEDSDRAKFALIINIPHADVAEFAEKWALEHNEINISLGGE